MRAHVAGREGRPHSGALLPVSEFGLRVSVYTSGDVFNLQIGCDPVKKISQIRTLRLSHVISIH